MALEHRNSEKFITIVSGLPRSGTSMMMRMLEVGGMPVLTDNIRTADEDNPFGFYEFEPVKQIKHDNDWLIVAQGKAVKMVYLLLFDLPMHHEYRVIFMRRDLEEVLASQRSMLHRKGEVGPAIGDEQMARLFRSQLNKFDEWARARPNLSVLDTSYNEIVNDPMPCIEAVNHFLGGELDSSAMMGVVDRSLYRNRRR